jgi:hypothetical protein
MMLYDKEVGKVKIAEESEANMALPIFAGTETASIAVVAIPSQLLQTRGHCWELWKRCAPSSEVRKRSRSPTS